MKHQIRDSASPGLLTTTPRKRVREPKTRYALQATDATKFSAAELSVVMNAVAILENRLGKGKRAMFENPAAVRAWLTLHYGLLQREVLGVILLDVRHRLLAHEQPCFGSITYAEVQPRELVRMVFAHNAAAVILVHGHPSGITEPSNVDINLTHQLKQLLLQLDVKLLDHFIVAGSSMLSFAERGLL